MSSRIIPFWLPNVGCTSRCLYCDQHLTLGEAIEMPSPDDIGTTLAAAIADGGDKPLEAAFYGGTFTALPPEVQSQFLAPATELRRLGLLDGIRISTHPSYLDGGSVSFLKDHGVTTVELGIQSFSDPILALAGRTYTEADALRTCRLVMGTDLALVVQLMPQLPSALAEDDIHSARVVANLKPDAVRLFPTVVLKATGLAGWYEAGRYIPPTLEQTAQRVAEMLEIIGPANISVLRIGLQASTRLDGAVLAGPYHPALGEHCWSALLARLAGRGLARLHAQGVESPTLRVAPRLASLLTGHQQAGLKSIAKAVGDRPFGWRLDEAIETSGTALWSSLRFTVRLTGDSVAIS